MSPLDRAILAERTAALHRHMARVADRLPVDPGAMVAATDAADAVILHLWQATQITIDLAVAFCADRDLGGPTGYADAFRRIATAGVIDNALADRLVRASGFRNLVAHAYGTLDMRRVHAAATTGPADLQAFVAALARAMREE